MIAFGPESRSRKRRTRPFQRYVRALLATSLLLALAVILTGYLKLGVPSGAGEEAEEARDRQRIERPVYTTRLPNGALLTFSAAYAIPHAAESSAALSADSGHPGPEQRGPFVLRNFRPGHASRR